MPLSAYILALVLSHGLNQVDCTNDVVCVVQHGKLHALSNSFASSKVDDSVKPAPLLALGAQCILTERLSYKNSADDALTFQQRTACPPHQSS